MPHNLYLHSSIVQTRAFGVSVGDRREALRYAVFDSTLALGFALFVNARSEEHTSNSSHLVISYAVFCLKKKKKYKISYIHSRTALMCRDYLCDTYDF